MKHSEGCQAHNQYSIKVSTATIITLNHDDLKVPSQSSTRKSLSGEVSSHHSPQLRSGTVSSVAPWCLLSILCYHNTAPWHTAPEVHLCGARKSRRVSAPGQGLWACTEESVRPAVFGEEMDSRPGTAWMIWNKNVASDLRVWFCSFSASQVYVNDVPETGIWPAAPQGEHGALNMVGMLPN